MTTGSNATPLLIRHRVNSIAQLQTVNPLHGCEIDLRSDLDAPGALHVSHDPWARGENFEQWLKVFIKQKISGPLILNTKEDGLENQLIELLERQKIKNYFFLDTTIPTLVHWVGKGIKNFAVRVSAYEPEEAALRFAKQVDWIWLDCFHKKPVTLSRQFQALMGAKICLVSPDLQGGTTANMTDFKGVPCDAICTKQPDAWTMLLSKGS